MTKHYNIGKIYEYASEFGERAQTMFSFSHSKSAISFNILLVLQILCLRNIYIFRSQITSALYAINAVSFYYFWYGAIRQYTDNTLTLRKICVSDESERAQNNFEYSHSIKLRFLSIFCQYFRYYMSVQMTCLSAYNVLTDKFPLRFRQNSEKALWRGGGGGQASPCPPPPPTHLATLVMEGDQTVQSPAQSRINCRLTSYKCACMSTVLVPNRTPFVSFPGRFEMSLILYFSKS